MPTEILTVAAGDDDAFQRGNGTGLAVALSAIRIEKSTNEAVRSVGGFRFDNVQIPRGARIVDARLTVNR